MATSAATFFRQIGGTMGTAVLLSVLFTLMPTNITGAMQNESTLKPALTAALTPSVASASENKGVMDQIWSKIVDPLQQNVQQGLDKGAAAAKQAADQAVTQQVTAQVQQQVAAGAIPAASADSVIAQQVAANKSAAEQQALETAASKANAEVVDGTLQIDYSNADQRKAVVDEVAPKLVDQLKNGNTAASSSAGSATSDTSFLNGADQRLTRPFLVGFSQSAVVVYSVGLAVILLAFVLTWFFRVPPLRKVSALQEQANAAKGDSDRLAADAQQAAANTGSLVAPDTGSMRAVPTSPDVTVQQPQDRPGGSTLPRHAPRLRHGCRRPRRSRARGRHAGAARRRDHARRARRGAPVDEPPATTATIRTHPAHAASDGPRNRTRQPRTTGDTPRSSPPKPL